MQNSIRHNLSLYDMFVRVKTTCAKGASISYWTLRSSSSSSSAETEERTQQTSQSNNNIHFGYIL